MPPAVHGRRATNLSQPTALHQGEHAGNAAPPVTIGRARHVRRRRSHGSLVVTWGAAPGAEGYGVAIRLSDGRQRSLEPRGTARRVSLHNVRKGTRVVVGVVATRASGARRGPVVRLRRRL